MDNTNDFEMPQFDQANTILVLAAMYDSTNESIAQSIDNPIDADATWIQVKVSPTSLLIVDNGTGMVPHMTSDDLEILKDYYEKSNKGELLPNYDVRKHLTPSSQKSFQFMYRAISLSGRVLDKLTKSNVKGMRGVGNLAIYQFGETAIYTSRPSLDLAREHYAKPGLQDRDIKTYQLLTPTKAELNMQQAPFRIVESKEPLVDAFGKPLAHGTRLEVTGITPEEAKSLIEGYFPTFLRGRYSRDILNGLKLMLIDSVSNEGKRTPGGKVQFINPPVYKGIPIIEEGATFFVRPNVSFQSCLFYNPRGRHEKVMIRREGSEVQDCATLDRFKKTLLCEGKFAGYIDFPTYPDDSQLWNSAKTVLRERSPERKQWEDAILFQIIPMLEKRVATYQEALNESELKSLARAATAAVTQALQEVEVFKGTTIPSYKPNAGSGRGKKGKQPRKPPQHHIAKVLSEYNQGVPDIEVELLCRGKLLDRKTTGKSGGVSFGRWTPNKYTIKVLIPAGMSAFERHIIEKETTEAEPGIKAVFKIHTGTTQPDIRPLGRIDVSFEEYMDEPEWPWIEQLHIGSVIINQLAPAFSEARARGNDAFVNVLLADYISAAVTLYTKKREDPLTLSLHRSMLFERLYELLTDNTLGTKRKMNISIDS